MFPLQITRSWTVSRGVLFRIHQLYRKLQKAAIIPNEYKKYWTWRSCAEN